MLADRGFGAPRRSDFRSADPQAVAECASRWLAPHHMRLCGNLDEEARLACIELHPVRIVDIAYGVDVRIEAAADPSHHFIHAAAVGQSALWHGDRCFAMRPDNLLITSPSRDIRLDIQAASRHRTVRMAASTFEDYLREELGIAVTRPVLFMAEGASGELPAAWRRLLGDIIGQVEQAPLLFAHLRAQRHYGRLMVELLLGNHRNTYSEQIALGGNEVTPWHVRRARDIIHASCNDAVSVSGLAMQVGVSVRSLQGSFRRFLGITPAAYIRDRRLERLHEALRTADADASVTGLMLASGIVHFGRFATYYRQRYGCRPSDTLRRHSRV